MAATSPEPNLEAAIAAAEAAMRDLLATSTPLADDEWRHDAEVVARAVVVAIHSAEGRPDD